MSLQGLLASGMSGCDDTSQQRHRDSKRCHIASTPAELLTAGAAPATALQQAMQPCGPQLSGRATAAVLGFPNLSAITHSEHWQACRSCSPPANPDPHPQTVSPPSPRPPSWVPEPAATDRGRLCTESPWSCPHRPAWCAPDGATPQSTGWQGSGLASLVQYLAHHQTAVHAHAQHGAGLSTGLPLQSPDLPTDLPTLT